MPFLIYIVLIAILKTFDFELNALFNVGLELVSLTTLDILLQ